MKLKPKLCEHLMGLDTSKLLKNTIMECSECVKTGDPWVHLRTCQECGATLCCDSSPNKHASKHAMVRRHLVAISAEPNEKWAWCYGHKSFLKYG